MSISEVFSKAYELWKRDVLWLILAGIVIGVIIWAVLLVAGLIVGALAIGGIGLGLSSSNHSFSGAGAGVIFVAIIVGIVAVFLIAVLGVTLQGGLFEMVIGAARDDRPVRFGDLFSGFRRFGAYALFALVVFGILIGLGILFVTLIGIPVAIALGIWIGIMWLYVLPLIADHNLTFGDAQRRSREMVKSAGWWRTFGQIILLWVIIAVVDIIISAIFRGGASDPGSAKYIAFQFISLIISAIWSTYTVCYISVMYLGSGGVGPAGHRRRAHTAAARRRLRRAASPARATADAGASCDPRTPPAPAAPGAAAAPPAPPAPEAAAAASAAAGAATDAGTAVTQAAGEAAAPTTDAGGVRRRRCGHRPDRGHGCRSDGGARAAGRAAGAARGSVAADHNPPVPPPLT